jgi:uncharacterized protein (DUF983 family)
VHASGIADSHFRKQTKAHTPLGRIGQPQDIAPAVVFLPSPDAGWITGEILFIADGFHQGKNHMAMRSALTAEPAGVEPRLFHSSRLKITRPGQIIHRGIRRTVQIRPRDEEMSINPADVLSSPGGGARRWWNSLWAIVRQRCPRCRKGRMFRGTFEMNDSCPVCGLLFQREEGYFLGAMYISYPMAVAILAPSYLFFSWLLPRWDSVLIVLLAAVPYVPLMPAVFRYSRVLWVHFDRWISPTDVSASAYEKDRRRQTDTGNDVSGSQVTRG